MKIIKGKLWIDCRCKCGCRITVKSSDKDAEKKIQAWVKKHKCLKEAGA